MLPFWAIRAFGQGFQYHLPEKRQYWLEKCYRIPVKFLKARFFKTAINRIKAQAGFGQTPTQASTPTSSVLFGLVSDSNYLADIYNLLIRHLAQYFFYLGHCHPLYFYHRVVKTGVLGQQEDTHSHHFPATVGQCRQ